MTAYEVAGSFGLVLAVGFLIGLQREQTMAVERAARGLFVGGIRTFPLVALAGAISAVLSRSFGAWIVAVTLAAMGALVAIAYHDDLRHGRDRGLTSEAAFVVTFLLGVFGLSPEVLPDHRLLIVAGLGVATTALLSMKDALHEWVARISKEDLYATVKFLVVAVIVLPLLPKEPVWEISPRQVGLLITLIAGVSFAGYVAFRILGAGRGLALTGLLGGLVSSTAVTLSLSGRAKEHPGIAPACAAGVVLAWTVMFVRVLAVIAVVHAGLARALAIPLLAAGAAGAVGSLISYRRMREGKADSTPIVLTNPFRLLSAVKFGALFAVVLVLSKLAVNEFGGSGLVVLGAVAGSTDVDAPALSASKLVHDNPNLFGLAALAVLVACASNTLVKVGMAIVLGGWGFGRRLLPVAAAMGAAGAAGAIVSRQVLG
ncbi:MAG TPA: MgtC/SapB family protein [Planctomycetota bacterium]|nr:MgtC/SapB family protein [Planctomycetota bacterium]